VARADRRYGEPGREDNGGRVVLLLVLVLTLLAGGAYVAAYLAASDKVPVGTSVAGVDIGGHSPSAAVVVLREGLSARVRTPFTVTINGRTQQVRPRQVGLGVDYAASVRNAGAGRSWAPSHLWTYYTAGSAYQPVVTLDQDKLATLIQRLDVTDGRTATDGSVVFRRQSFVVTPPRAGLALDPRSAGTAFWNAYLTDDPNVSLRLTATPPAIDAAAIHRFVRTFANRAVAAPVQLRFGQTPLRLRPSDYARLLVARRVGDRLRPEVQAARLAALTDRRLAGAPLHRPRDATVALVDGSPHVVPAKPGVTFAPHDVGAALLRAIASPGRTARVAPSLAKASFTNVDAARLGIRRQVSFAIARLPRGSQSAALSTAVRRIDGTVLRPGDALSLRGLLGAETPSGPAGDALATAVFDAAWLGGLRVTAHATPPSYDGRAPLGRDATLGDGQDLAFTDDSSYGVLVSVVVGRPTSAHGGSLTVSLWSTPYWTVTSSHGDPTNVVAAGRVVQHGKGCRARDGRDGFDVTVTRTFARQGATARTSSYTAHYLPQAAVVCKSSRHHRHHH
jgi:vancomycin resistance protein YoaR